MTKRNNFKERRETLPLGKPYFYDLNTFLKWFSGTFLVVQGLVVLWLRLLPLQGASVQSLVRELDPRCLVLQPKNKEVNETKQNLFLYLRIRLSLLQLLESFPQFLHILVLKQILVSFRGEFLGPAVPMSLGENQRCLIVHLSPPPLSNVLAQKPSSMDSRGTGSEISVTSPFSVQFSCSVASNS